jgi:proton-dependent oligopeptide transporter, POT family
MSVPLPWRPSGHANVRTVRRGLQLRVGIRDLTCQHERVNARFETAQPVASIRPWQLPAGARLVIVFEFCERVGFYSMASLLAVFLSSSRSSGGFGWKGGPALTLLGVFSGLMYALPVAGGFVADRFLGHRRALTWGGTLMLAAYLTLTAAVSLAGAVPSGVALGRWHLPTDLPAAADRLYETVSAAFWMAICALVLGNSLVKSTLVVALGDAFVGDDARRETAYAYYYAGINLGGLVAGVAAGSVAAAWGWAPAFGVSALAMGVALAAYFLFGRRYLKPRPPSRAARSQQTASAPAEGRLPAVECDAASPRLRLLILAVFALLLLVYETGSFQLWGTMSLFLERNVDRHAGLFEIPTQWFTSVEAAGLIVAAPAFAALWAWLGRRGREPDIVIKYALALSLGAVGLLLFSLSAWPQSGAARPGWTLPALGIWVQATGEVAAWTVSYGLVYRLAPPRVVAAVMGAFYAGTLGLGGYLAGWLGSFAEPLGQSRFFLVLGLATAATAGIALAIRPALRSLAMAKGLELDAHQ